MRCVRAFIVSLCALVLLAPAALAQWPTTCVELNDIVEAHLGNDENVGIYQRVFGDQAEQACQNDHRDDVRSVFAWAIGSTPEPPPPVLVPPVGPLPVQSSWEYYNKQEVVTGHLRHFAVHQSTGGEPVEIVVRCNSVTRDLDIYFGYPSEYLLAYNDQLPVQWRWNDDSQALSAVWPTSVSSESLFVPLHQNAEIGYGLVHAGRLAFRVTEDSDSQHTSVFNFVGAGASDHPVRRVFQACGQSV